MKKVDVFNLAKESIHGGTLSPMLFDMWVNEIYKRAQRKLRKVDANRDVVEKMIALTTTLNKYTLEADTGLILEVYYYDNSNPHFDKEDRKIVIPPTDVVETRGQTGLRCYRIGDVLHFRGIEKDISEVFIVCRTKLHRLKNDEDDLKLDDSSDAGFLVSYVLGKYYMTENMETNGREYLQESELLLKELVASIETQKKQKSMYLKAS